MKVPRGVREVRGRFLDCGVSNTMFLCRVCALTLWYLSPANELDQRLSVLQQSPCCLHCVGLFGRFRGW